jgi:hypothetical protein
MAAVLQDQVLKLASYPPGTYPIGFGQGAQGPLQVPDVDPADGSPVTVCDVAVQRCTTNTPNVWPEADIFVDTIPQVSLDGGQTWSECGAARGQAGGIQVFKGAQVAWSPSGGGLPAGVNGIPRLWRCTFIVTDASGQNRPIRTSVRVQID